MSGPTKAELKQQIEDLQDELDAAPFTAPVGQATCRIDPSVIRQYSNGRTEEYEVSEAFATSLGIPARFWR